MKITQADAPTIWMDCHPSRLICAPNSVIPTIYMPDAIPGAVLPIYPDLGRARNMLACIPGGWLYYCYANYRVRPFLSSTAP